MSTDGLKTVVL